MFNWEPLGKKNLKTLPNDLFSPTKSMAANQGLYNGFLAAGLIWSLFISSPEWSFLVEVFFLGCVIVTVVCGGIWVSKRIFMVQAMPTILAMTVLLIYHQI